MYVTLEVVKVAIKALFLAESIAVRTRGILKALFNRYVLYVII